MPGSGWSDVIDVMLGNRHCHHLLPDFEAVVVASVAVRVAVDNSQQSQSQNYVAVAVVHSHPILVLIAESRYYGCSVESMLNKLRHLN